MKRFVPLLKEINEKLVLPQPEKSRILLEIGADMADLFDHYLKQGKSETEAMQIITEKFRVCDDAISELIVVHQGFIQKLANKISRQAQSFWEKAGLLLFLLGVILVCGRIVISAQFFHLASPYITPVIMLALFIAVLAFIKFYSLYIKKNHSIKTINNGMKELLILGCGCLLIGVFGNFMELYDTFKVMAASPENSTLLLFEWLEKTAPLMVFTLSVTSITALLWYMLQNKINKIQNEELAFLLNL
ncbi:MAG TPA: hypothetical protein PLP19_21890 [bacterium]|nr:hypothetical protein [bacterium]HPN46151.1 hypothetical protein [bacterium]